MHIFLLISRKSNQKDHEEKARQYPEEFLKSRFFKSPVFKRIEGKIISMHVLVVGYDLDVVETHGKAPIHFKNILHLPFEVVENKENGHNVTILKEKIKYINII